MSDNYNVKDASGVIVSRKTKDISANHASYVLICDASGNVLPSGDAAARASYVQLTNGTIALGVFAEDAAHTSGDKGILPLAVRNDTHTNALSSTDADYTPLAVDSSGKLGIRGTFAEDAAHTSGDLGHFLLAVRADAAAVSSGTDGDYSALIVDATGRLWTHVDAITAGETHIGETSDPRTVLSVTPTVSTSPAYTSGDAVGGKQTLTSAARVSGGVTELDSLTVIDKGNQKAPLCILIFDSDPSAATITDNAALALSTAVSKVIAKVNVATADYVTVDSIAFATYSLKDLGIVLKASGTANLFCAVLTTGTPTFASTTDLTFRYGLKQS